MTEQRAASVTDAFERALGAILARVCVSGDVIGVAYSGGLDSSVLLHLAHRYANARNIALHAFHIHHGLSPNADAWLAHCRTECERLGIVFDARYVELAGSRKTGVEEAARLARYAALGELCRQHRVPLLLTAHHQDDQAETVLLQLLRGSGVAGLAGMEAANTAPRLLGDPGLVMARPLLSMARAELANFAMAEGIAYVDDESNRDPRYARNALRHHVMPALDRYFPGFQERLARSAMHAQSAHQLQNEIGSQDLAQCMDGESIDIVRLKRLGEARMDNALRCWFASRGMRMPSTAWLAEMRAQLLEAREDARVCVVHPDCQIRRHRDRIYMTVESLENRLVARPVRFRWNGEHRMHFPGFGGTLCFEPAEEGIDAEWLRRQDLQLHYRSGGERLKPAPNRPTRSLKHHYQALDIPSWERERLPLLSGPDGLVFAAGIGMDCRHYGVGNDTQVRISWRHDKGSA